MTSIRGLLLRHAAVAVLAPLAAFSIWLIGDREAAARAAARRELRLAALAAREVGANAEGLRRLAAAFRGRLTWFDAAGRPLADSETAGGQAEDPPPEVAGALQTGEGYAERPAAGGEATGWLAVAGPDGITRAAAPLAPYRAGVGRTRVALLAALVLFALTALWLADRLARRLGHPIQELADAADRFVAGNPVEVAPDGPAALRRLGTAFNEMARRLNAQVRELDESQAYLEAVLRQMPEGLLVLDAQGVITRTNPAALALLDTTAERLVGKPVLAALLNLALEGEVRRVLTEAAAGAEARGGTLEIRAPDRRALRAAIAPFYIGTEPDRALAGAVLILQDLSELRRADDMRRDFVANVSHELRTPIAAIRALAETLLLRGERRPELIGEYGPRIVGECERIDRLVQDLMLLAQTESGHLELAPEALDPREIALEVARQVEPVAAPAGVAIELEDFPGARVQADRFALSQCLRNLVDNAVRYAGGRILVGADEAGGEVILRVRDEGPGIPPEALARVFERFYRLDRARSRDDGGSGLGLSIVRHLTEAQGGRVWVESRVGYGATFFIALPRAQP